MTAQRLLSTMNLDAPEYILSGLPRLTPKLLGNLVMNLQVPLSFSRSMPPENEYADLQKVARRATSVKNL